MAPTPTNDDRAMTHIKISNILDLPDEILKEICGHCYQPDWVCLSLVNKRFRDLAAAQLYRNFRIVFPDEDDPCFDSPIDGLAGGLSTFVTSDYNYAKHLREVSLDTLSVGDRAAIAYKPYLANVSCGKFMNTLFLLTLRKAQSLDTFRWNIRVELSRPVYEVLHSIKSLRHLHIRLQAGPSLYEAPPPLPYSGTQSPSPTQWVNPNTSPLDPLSLYGPPPPALAPPSPVFKPSWKNKPSKKSDVKKEPPTISGFKNLETLSVLDMDNLDVVTEIKACVRNSSSTLRKLKLSFSDNLAMQARKPTADPDLDESEDEEFQVVPLSTPANYDNNGPARVFRAQEERKAQESVLGRIFELEQFRVRDFRITANNKKEEKPKEQQPSREGQQFIDDVTKVFQRMAAHVNGTSNFTYLEQQDALDLITKAARKYVNFEESKTDPKPSTEDKPTGEESHVSSKELESKSTSNGGTTETQPSTSKTKDTAYDVDPDDIDITVPEEQLAVDTGVTDVTPSKETVNSAEEVREFNPLDEDAEAQLRATVNRIEANTEDVRGIERELTAIAAEVQDARTQNALPPNEKEKLLSSVSQYTRDTRGIGLRSLSIHLIPIKASVLGRAIDLHMLRRVTLLNVGEQKKFWSLMTKENNQKPLALRKVFTDDVCLPFLQLVSQLSHVNEVFMLQRSAKYKPESFAPNPGTTIEQIRKFVLKKHLHSLKRLMIKNQADSSWDVDDKTVQLICKRGRKLEELAVIMGMRAIHVFIQFMPNLVNLRALQLVSFRTDDTCLSVMRETRRFIVDAVSHHPELKLEWLALGENEHERTVRITRKPETPKEPKKGPSKGKQPALNLGHDYNGGHFPVVPVWDVPSDSEDDEDDGPFLGQKLEMIEDYAFYDVFGVRIFKKEVQSGRL
ncbi:uncharacterized protein F4822DRAFT_416682 [Hypoxylon trugodes]|uniref:uncharacterized protein n=1 Tax=Hypoxylon trugodes TaxID=326681 RepID=UPI00218D9B56|nr:uncharacterized protein F4822DRAFT_416682 [Hypoxylon trugodes]KAI1384915.1 hypothetical protein F4822DRAFT_416682 [Hypoxylon trugodes]